MKRKFERFRADLVRLEIMLNSTVNWGFFDTLGGLGQYNQVFFSSYGFKQLMIFNITPRFKRFL